MTTQDNTQQNNGNQGDDTQGNQGNTQQNNQNTPDTEKKFTQADLDRHIAERLGRVKADKAAVEGEIIAQLGVSDIDAAKKLIEAAKKAETDALSAQEKLEKQLKDAEDARLKAEQDALTAKTSLQVTLNLSAMKDALAKAGTSNEKVALLLVQQQQSEFIGDDGLVKNDKLTSIVEQIKKDEPYLFTAKSDFRGFRSSQDGTTVNPNEDAAKKAKAEMDKIIRRR